ncbi:helix-turn-helix domain-containing protein [Streptomyces sp. NPDC094143]|uniref:helix-turn-helix transcriptional regulator n=1 Tax=Streptomyces sp. NPDC094143 TaxID=3155310 RepID=UPI00331C3C4A
MSARDDVNDVEGVEGEDDVAEFAASLRALKERTDRSYGSLARRLAMNTSTLHRYCVGEAVPLDFAPVERFAALCGASPGERLDLHRRWLLAVAARRRPRTTATGGVTEDAGGVTGDAGGVTEDPCGVAEDAGTAQDADAAREGRTTQAAGAPHGTRAARAAGMTQDRGATQDAGAPQDAHPAQEAGVSIGQGGAPEGTGAGAGDRPGAGAVLVRRPWYRRRRLAVGVAAACAALATLGSLAALPDGRREADDDRARGAGPVTPGATRTPAPERRGASPTPSTSPTPERSAPSAGPKAKGRPAPAPSDPTTAPPQRGADPAAPLAWSANSQAWKLGCGHDYVVTKPPAQVPPPPVPQDAGAWAASVNAVHGGETLVRLSVQGRSDTAVVLDALRVRVVGRADPVQGNAYAMDQGCGGSLTPRSFDVDLDKDRPIARAVAGSDAGTPIPAVSMPYRVSARDPEVLLVNARTRGCDCRWYLELDWSSQGRSGTVRVDDGGRPFRTSGITGLPRYLYDTSARQWAPYR